MSEVLGGNGLKDNFRRDLFRQQGLVPVHVHSLVSYTCR